MRLGFRGVVSVAALAVGFAAAAQTITFTNVNPAGPMAAFPKQNPAGPAGIAYQSNYPYEGQCVTAPNQALFPLLPVCTLTNAPSFACTTAGTSNQSAGSNVCGAVTPFTELAPLVPTPAIKYMYEVLNPPDYVPDTATFPGADYYEIGVHEAWGFDGLARAGAFPHPGPGITVPNGKQWTGIVGPAGNPVFTPVWGVGQINMNGGPITGLLAGAGLFNPAAGPATEWSQNDYVATWPSINIRATRGRPVVVKWVNEFPNNHVFCAHPEAADWPCAIDRTFMGVKSKIDPALANGVIPPEGVNEFGSPQQPDNSWVTHLHGGEIPPSTDGFAEKWFGNRTTAVAFNGFANNYLNPPFESPLKHPLSRPATYFDTYAYPMIQEEALIWFHDHTLGKTHHNVIAGPAGFFPVYDPRHHTAPGSQYDLANNFACTPEVPGGDCLYGWLDVLSRPRDAIGRPLYDFFLAVQDRAFNSDGSINFSNGLGQALPALWPGYTSITPGVNPMVHPTWVPEYFGEFALVNGVAWPKATVAPGWYRLRFVNGSDSRCYTSGFATVQPAPGTMPRPNVPFFVLANDQGYLQQPAPVTTFTMCPGERYELLVDFSNYNGMTITMTNSAAAPFPFGLPPFGRGTPWPDMNTIMAFNVTAVGTPPAINTCVPPRPNNCLRNPGPWMDTTFVRLNPAAPGVVERQVYLNEKVDGVTLAPLGMQLNGVPFEYKVTETPVEGTTERWKFINLTVDAHPMHPHLVKHQIVSRQNFNVGAYKALLCGSATCQPGPSPGNEMQVVPDVTPLLAGGPIAPAPYETGWKDATPAPPGQVTTIVAKWEARWPQVPAASATAPGAALGLDAAACNPNPAPVCVTPVAGQPLMTADPTCMCVPDAIDPTICAQPEVAITFVPAQPAACSASTWTYEEVTSGPYVWHCHINSHEDSEMMRTSLVVK